MARRRQHEEHVNHEAWAIPYGDLITLLLAFFVVMYAMSSVNEGKYRILSDSLVAAFRSAPKALEPIQIGQASKSLHRIEARQQRTLVPLEMDAPQIVFVPEEEIDAEMMAALGSAGLDAEQLNSAAELIDEISNALQTQLDELVRADLVRLRRNRFWVEIEINTSVLFTSGSADVAPAAVPILERLSGILADTETRIQVEGHTDDEPIHTIAYPSNWELSAARAANVVRLFAANDVAPEHLAAVGYGEFRPTAPNDTVDGRRQNRRVVIVVIARAAESLRRMSETTMAAAGGNPALEAVAP